MTHLTSVFLATVFLAFVSQAGAQVPSPAPGGPGGPAITPAAPAAPAPAGDMGKHDKEGDHEGKGKGKGNGKGKGHKEGEKKQGLDRADEAAGEHGKQGRE